jgi:hypothetical protein
LILNSINTGSWIELNKILPIALSSSMNINLILIQGDGTGPKFYRSTSLERPIVYIAKITDCLFHVMLPSVDEEAASKREILKKMLETDLSDYQKN